MKILVVVSGLVLLVPDGDSRVPKITALLAEDMMHKIAFRQLISVDENGPVLEWPVKDQNFELVIETPHRTGFQAEIVTPVNFMALGTLAPGAKVKPDCLNGSCKYEEDQLLAGRVQFIGDWKARPVSRCDFPWSTPVAFTDTVEVEARRRAKPSEANASLGKRPRATGAALEATVSSLSNLQVVLNKTKLKLNKSDPKVCAEWGTTAPCIVLAVENWTTMALPASCEKEPLPEVCKWDEHFQSIYDLLDPGALPAGKDMRWLPFIASTKDMSCDGQKVGGAGNFPALRCPIGVIP